MNLPEHEVNASASAVALGRTIALILLCAYGTAVPAAENWTVSALAGGGDGVKVTGVEAQVPSGHRGALTDRWSWSLAWAGNVAYWWARHGDLGASLGEVGLTPVVELRRATAGGKSYYVEGGIGVRLLSQTHIERRRLSTAFQFGEIVGAGVNFGDRGQYGVGVRVQHVSNCHLKSPNDGVTFAQIRISYRWE